MKAKPKRHKKQKSKNVNTPSQVSINFEVSVHGIHHRRCKYSLICKMQRCGKKFSKVQDWNSHHRLQHASVFRCGKCFKVYPTPISYRDHIYSHCETQYKCQQCDHNFPFSSGVKNHQRAHLEQKLFKCFAGGCESAFKNPQDLHRHIVKHI